MTNVTQQEYPNFCKMADLLVPGLLRPDFGMDELAQILLMGFTKEQLRSLHAEIGHLRQRSLDDRDWENIWHSTRAPIFPLAAKDSELLLELLSNGIKERLA